MSRKQVLTLVFGAILITVVGGFVWTKMRRADVTAPERTTEPNAPANAADQGAETRGSSEVRSPVREVPDEEPRRELGSTLRVLVVDELVLLVVVVHLAIQVECDIRSVTGDVRIASRLGIALRLAARFYAVEEIANVERRRVAADFFDLSSRK